MYTGCVDSVNSTLFNTKFLVDVCDHYIRGWEAGVLPFLQCSQLKTIPDATLANSEGSGPCKSCEATSFEDRAYRADQFAHA